MNTKNVKLVIFVPLSHADAVRQALGEAGAGKIGNYDFCSFSSRGTGRFRGNEKTNPAIGEAGKYEAAEQEKSCRCRSSDGNAAYARPVGAELSKVQNRV